MNKKKASFEAFLVLKIDSIVIIYTSKSWMYLLPNLLK